MKRASFCPSCGKTLKEDQEFCSSCKPEIEIEIKDLNFELCEKCGKFNFRNKWREAKTKKSAIIEILTQSTKATLDKITVSLPNITMKAGVNVDFKAIVNSQEQDYEIEGRFLMTICPKCSRDNSTYFEGILQLRNPKDEVKQYIDKMLSAARIRSVYASSVKEVTNGLDYYITSKSYLRKMGRELKKRFDGDYNESAQLFSRNHQTSKDIYRINVLFRCK